MPQDSHPFDHIGLSFRRITFVVVFYVVSIHRLTLPIDRGGYNKHTRLPQFPLRRGQILLSEPYPGSDSYTAHRGLSARRSGRYSAPGSSDAPRSRHVRRQSRFYRIFGKMLLHCGIHGAGYQFGHLFPAAEQGNLMIYNLYSNIFTMITK